MFKFIHAADLHLDSPLRGLSALADAPTEEIRTATRKALQNLVDLCIAERVAFVLIAGDVYDGDWEDYTTGLFFTKSMARLREHGIRVFLIRGNHDAQSQISRRLTLPDNVKEFRTDMPETVILDDLAVAIHGQGFATRAVTENLAAGYPPAEPWMFNIGLLHTAAEGQEGHEPYAPCRVDELVQKGYQYWALGHIHKRQLLHEDPYILFPGNIQGRHIREEGEKGCTVVTVDGLAVSLEHRNLDVLRWYTCTVDLSEVSNSDDFAVAVQSAVGEIADANLDCRLALRVICEGETEIHGEILEDPERYIHEIQNAAAVVGGERVWIEKVKFDTSHQKTGHGTLAADPHGLGSLLLRTLESAKQDDVFIADFLRHTKVLQGNLRDYLQTADATKVESAADLDTLLGDAEDLLLTILAKGGIRQ
ncbi:metallophosphoesterase family protein [Alicyclobacillus ferrooxydans]|uniref:metallophosphoesterase family protein n=1 Tax=Alicyclobacillus ferrooxydans TaxID=471514 RepID=UPI0006D5906B|nr:DNA repair exonuclease [Alicyclobacillus ferrooxydans]